MTTDSLWWGTNGAVLILCGGLIERERELIDPSYELDIPLQSGGRERMSILEWRLHELAEGLESNPVKLPVVLLTTPDTEAVVEQSLRRYQRAAERTGVNSPLNVIRSSAQLIPELNDDRTAYAPADDGGWVLRPRGHIDAVRTLTALKELNQPLHGRKCAVLFAFNNLGEVTSAAATSGIHATYEWLRGNGATFAVELFRYEKPTASDDSRWQQLSACLDSSRPILWKPFYGPGPHTNGPRFYSSLTWYVDLERLPPDIDGVLASLGFVSSAKRPGVLRQDLDMLTHHDGIKVTGLVPEEGQPASSLYRYRRYLGVRTQDHVRHATFTDAFREQTFLKRGHSPTLPDPKPAFIVTEPRYQHYVWGGEHIAMLKGLPLTDRLRRVAETWEISLHQSGHSSAVLNANETRPLGDIAKELADLPTDEIDFMAKYLDCHQPLSIQVHPDATTGRSLFRRVLRAVGPGDADHVVGRRGDGAGPQPPSTVFHVRDSGGKEENFLVLKLPSEKQFHLVLGFDQDQLRPMAHRVRRLFDAKANQAVLDPSAEKTLCVDIARELCSALQTECGASLLTG